MNDKQFMTILLGVIGVLSITFFIIFFIAQIIVPDKKVNDEFTNNNVISRIEPIGKLNYSSSNEFSENLESWLREMRSNAYVEFPDFKRIN